MKDASEDKLNADRLQSSQLLNSYVDTSIQQVNKSDLRNSNHSPLLKNGMAVMAPHNKSAIQKPKPGFELQKGGSFVGLQSFKNKNNLGHGNFLNQ